MSGPSLPQTLVESLRTRLRGPRGSSIELAIEAAVTQDPAERAWRLVALAARLRREHELDLARAAVRAALALDAGPEPTRAAYTCAVALHADEGDLATAVRVGEELLAEHEDAYLLKTMARVYWLLWRQTKDEDWHDRWWRVHVHLQGPAAA